MADGWPQVDLSEPLPLLGGEDSEVWHCGDHVVRVHPASAPATEIAWCQAWAAHTATVVPEVVVALADGDGDTLRALAGRHVEVQPFVPGRQPDPGEDAVVDQVTDLLVRMADASRTLDLRGLLGERPGWGGRPWDRPRWVTASGLVDEALDEWYAVFLDEHAHERLALHADVHEGNLIERDGTIVGVLDPDDARVMHPLEEVAFAAWEFARPPGVWRLTAAALQGFLDSYEIALDADLDRLTVLRLMRVQLRISVGHHLTDDPQPDVATMIAASFGQVAVLESRLERS